jgi:four helix bundle protein
MQDFRNLKVWEKAHALTLDVYRTTRSFPSDERFGLTNQLRRSCSSVPANLAEGCARFSDIDFARFVNNAAGSASETDYHLLLARDLHTCNNPSTNHCSNKSVRSSECLTPSSVPYEESPETFWLKAKS